MKQILTVFRIYLFSPYSINEHFANCDPVPAYRQIHLSVHSFFPLGLFAGFSHHNLEPGFGCVSQDLGNCVARSWSGNNQSIDRYSSLQCIVTVGVLGKEMERERQRERDFLDLLPSLLLGWVTISYMKLPYILYIKVTSVSYKISIMWVLCVHVLYSLFFLLLLSSAIRSHSLIWGSLINQTWG